jgi:25S rRNA (adenine2142-N1)-methyltransferase
MYVARGTRYCMYFAYLSYLANASATFDAKHFDCYLHHGLRMPKAKKRKNPIVVVPPASTSSASVAAQSCRNTIRKYHVLLKQRRQLENGTSPDRMLGLAEIDQQLSALGGLEKYQELSSLGQRDERGGGSEKVFIAWMKDLDAHRPVGSKGRLRCVCV